MRQFCLSKKTCWFNHNVSKSCVYILRVTWKDASTPDLVFFIQWRCADNFHFFGRTCCNFPRFCIPHFFDQLWTQQCQSWHQCMVRESDHSGFSFSSLCFGSSPEKAGPPGPAYETLSCCHGGFSPRNFGIWGPKLWRHEWHLQKLIFHPCFQLFLDLVSLVFLCGSPGYWSYHVFRKDQRTVWNTRL